MNPEFSGTSTDTVNESEPTAQPATKITKEMVAARFRESEQYTQQQKLRLSQAPQKHPALSVEPRSPRPYNSTKPINDWPFVPQVGVHLY